MGYAYFVQTHWDSQLNCIETNRYRSFADSWWCWSVHSHVNAIRNTFTTYNCEIAISFVSSSIDLTFWKRGGGVLAIQIELIFMTYSCIGRLQNMCSNAIMALRAVTIIATWWHRHCSPHYHFAFEWFVSPRLTNTIERIKLENVSETIM